MGYPDYDNAATAILFQLVNRRDESNPVIRTTNLAFRDWCAIFPNATSASALVDRLTHHSRVVVIKGDSYRKHEARRDRQGSKDVQDELPDRGGAACPPPPPRPPPTTMSRLSRISTGDDKVCHNHRGS